MKTMKMLKKMMACVAAIIMTLSLAACGAIEGISVPESHQVTVGEKITVVVGIVSNEEGATEEDIKKAIEGLNLTWSVADESVATVDENGVVCGISEGDTELTVATGDGSMTAVSKIVVLPAPEPTPAAGDEGDDAELTEETENEVVEEEVITEPTATTTPTLVAPTTAPVEENTPIATPEPQKEEPQEVSEPKHEEKPEPKPIPTCALCGSTSHTSHPTCAVCGSTSHTNHPTCSTCGSTDHTTHPAPEPEVERCDICGSTEHTKHPALDKNEGIEHKPETGNNEASDSNAVLEE